MSFPPRFVSQLLLRVLFIAGSGFVITALL